MASLRGALRRRRGRWRRWWRNSATPGLSQGGFIKADNIYAARGDFETLFQNIIKHELGHMFNIAVHSDQVRQSAAYERANR
jgi:predicted Zn-dependent protease